MHVLQRKVFKMVCKVYLEGRGNSDLRKIQDLGPRFRIDRANTIFLKLLLLPSGLCLLFPKICKSLLVSKFRKDKRDCIRELLSN